SRLPATMAKSRALLRRRRRGDAANSGGLGSTEEGDETRRALGTGGPGRSGDGTNATKHEGPPNSHNSFRKARKSHFKIRNPQSALQFAERLAPSWETNLKRGWEPDPQFITISIGSAMWSWPVLPTV